ncbi:hypothetical protein [Streptomyces sp. NPDC054765]
MRFTPTFRTVAAGCIPLGALFLTQAAFPGGTPSLAQVRADGPPTVTVPDGNPTHLNPDRIVQGDVTWGS